jgi:hypothetical protein
MRLQKVGRLLNRIQARSEHWPLDSPRFVRVFSHFLTCLRFLPLYVLSVCVHFFFRSIAASRVCRWNVASKFFLFCF